MARARNAYGFCVAGGLHNFDKACNVMRSLSAEVLAPALDDLRRRGQVGLSELQRRP